MITQTFGQYRVLEKLGAGGMGEVYRARDTRLGRDIALKILPAELTGDVARIRRFQQEARAASALNHPHIVALFDTGCCDSTHFIAMELIEGQPLTEWLKRGRPKPARILEVITQVADALDAAHRAGILHRDIKPANLLVTEQGYAKVVDFGLAKLTEAITGDATQSSATAPGAVMGTAAYMSPEQALGKPLDARTDVFSLGAVLYEAVTGRRAFPGDTGVDVLHAVVHAAPQQLSELAPRAPAELRWVLDKALAKDPDERYQSMRELAVDLRRLRRGLDASGSFEAPAAFAAAAPASRPWLYAAAGAAMTLVVLAVLVVVPAVRVRLRGAARSGGLLEGITMTPLTSDPGYEGEAVFSPDGETIAYVSDRTGNFEIFLKQVSGGPDINLTNNPADDVQPAFSPDGKRIAFVSSRDGGSEIYYGGVQLPEVGGDLWVMAALGGTARRIASGANFPSWSPDGSAILYSTGPWFAQKISRVPTEGGEAREIPIRFPSDSRRPSHLLYPSYSRDARWILLEADSTIWAVSAQGGEAQRVGPGNHPVWCADPPAILYSNAEPGKNRALWRVPFSLAEGRAAGPPEPLTVSHGREVDASPSRDGKRIVVTEQEFTLNVEEVPFNAEAGRVTGPPRPLTRGNDMIFFKSYSPDSRSVAYESQRGGLNTIWRETDGGTPVQLTSDTYFVDGGPKWSLDGRTIGFSRQLADRRQANDDVWLMDADGTNPRKLIEGAAGSAWLPDSHAFVYYSLKDRQLYLYDMPSGASRRLTNESGIFQIFTVSQDGQWIVFQSNQTGKIELHAVPAAGGASRVVVSIEPSVYHPSFSPSGRWLYFQPTHKNLYRVPGPAQGWRAATPEKVTNFPESGLFLEDPLISPDGHRLLVSRGRITADLWLLRLAP